MAKHKPTARTIRQGQTVYWINTFGEYSPELRPLPKVEKYFVYSHKEPLPPYGCKIIKVPVTRLKQVFDNVGNNLFYYSRAKAHRRALQL